MTLQQERPAPVQPAILSAFDEALREDEERVDALLKSAKKYLAALQAWKKSAQTGNYVARQKAVETARQTAPTLSSPVEDAADAWSYDVAAWLQTDALREIQEAGSRIGLRTLRDGETLVAPPVVVRAIPTRNALKIGKDNRTNLRPRVVAEELKKLRDRKSAAGSAEFLECLYGIWRKVSSKENPAARFRDIYDYFSLTPGWKKDNPEGAFGQSLYALQTSGLRMTRKEVPFQIEWPSGNVKDKDLFTVYAEDGKPLRYYAIRFMEKIR